MIKTILISSSDIKYFNLRLTHELNILSKKGINYDIKYSTTSFGDEFYNSALIIYKEE